MQGGTLSPTRQALVDEVSAGLSRPQKELPSKLLYDQRGSELFEEITTLPEYYPTRTEQALLSEWMPRWIAKLRPCSLVELGAGSAEKSRTILDAMRSNACADVYVPVDISAEFLEQTAVALREEYAGLRVLPVATDFTREFELPTALARPALITILGSTIGNFVPADAAALLARVRAAMVTGDRFLLGVDLRKNVAILEAAYNDSRGVTAAFNLNLLHVLKRDLGADVDVHAFRHRAFYIAAEHRIEMHLVSERPQTIHMPTGGRFELREGETIRTEISCKHDRNSVGALFEAAGLEVDEWVTDGRELFALALGARTPR